MTENQMRRFWQKVDKTGDGGRVTFNGEACWLWTGRIMACGYGQFALSHNKPVQAHRLAYELLHGEPVPPGLEADHLCRNRACVLHTEAVTHRENVLRGNGVTARNAAKTHCDHGHALSGDNLYLRPDGRRACRQCKRDWERRNYAATKEGNA